jgi:tetratricopeptide (TPR) repeat protein
LTLGRLDEALRSGNRALAIARRLRDLRLRLISTSYVAQAHYYAGEYQPVVALAADNLAALPAEWLYEVFDDALGRRDTPLSVRDRGWLVMSLAELGRYAEAAEPATEAVRIAEATQSPFVIAWAHMSAGALYQRKGDWSRALSHFEQATTMMREGNIVVMLDTMLVYSAWMLAQLGDEKGALSRLREGERLVERLAATGFVGLLRTRYQVLARAAFTLGRIGEARRLGRLAFESLPLQSGRAANLLHLLGDIAAHRDCFDADSSEAHYLAALELAKPRGMRPLVAHCHLGLGKLYRRTGARKQAQEHVATATTMYREMDMPFWLEQAEVEPSS